MDALVTGATGVLGHCLVERLVANGHDRAGQEDQDADLVERRGGRSLEGDVLDPGSLAALDPPEVLVHAATAIPTSDTPTTKRGSGTTEFDSTERGT